MIYQNTINALASEYISPTAVLGGSNGNLEATNSNIDSDGVWSTWDFSANPSPYTSYNLFVYSCFDYVQVDRNYPIYVYYRFNLSKTGQIQADTNYLRFNPALLDESGSNYILNADDDKHGSITYEYTDSNGIHHEEILEYKSNTIDYGFDTSGGYIADVSQNYTYTFTYRIKYDPEMILDSTSVNMTSIKGFGFLCQSQGAKLRANSKTFVIQSQAYSDADKHLNDIDDNTKGILDFLINDLFDGIGNLLDIMTSAISDLFDSLAGTITTLIDNLIAFIQWLFVPTSEDIENICNEYINRWSASGGLITFPLTLVSTLINNIYNVSPSNNYPVNLPEFHITINGHNYIIWQSQNLNLSNNPMLNQYFNNSTFQTLGILIWMFILCFACYKLACKIFNMSLFVDDENEDIMEEGTDI